MISIMKVNHVIDNPFAEALHVNTLPSHCLLLLIDFNLYISTTLPLKLYKQFYAYQTQTFK